jgi:hypothetical protein
VIGFLNPLVLLGLVLAGVPPLLHLLGRRQPPTVIFPAIQYLSAAEREHSRRLKLRNLLLMALRVAVIVLIVLAAARPVVRSSTGRSHPPTALGLIVDNSLSAGAVVGGRSVLEVLIERARGILGRLSPDDRLWLVLADGLPERMSPEEALGRLESLTARPRRLDLGAAVRATAAAIGDAPTPYAEVVVVADLQSTAITAGAPVELPVLLAEPPAVPANAGVDSARAEPVVWTREGTVVAAIGGGSERAAAVRLVIDEVEVDRTVGRAGERVVLRATPRRPGWTIGEVRLEPDELRADDRRFVAVRVAGPVGARISSGVGRYLREALEVLQESGVLAAGSAVTLGEGLVPGAVVVVPPSDPALVGALNRALARRGVGWRLGPLREGEWTIEEDGWGVAGTAVYRRFGLTGSGEVLTTVAGEPWLVRDGDVTLLASRLEPEWTALPTSAGFLPFVEALVSRIAVRESGAVRAVSGEPVGMPTGATGLLLPAGELPLGERRGVTAPDEPGVYFLAGAGGDTVGALEVNHDLRESLLDRADAAELRAALGDRARLLSAGAFDRELFGGARRAELTSGLLIAAVVVALAELLVSTATARTRRP